MTSRRPGAEAAVVSSSFAGARSFRVRALHGAVHGAVVAALLAATPGARAQHAAGPQPAPAARTATAATGNGARTATAATGNAASTTTAAATDPVVATFAASDADLRNPERGYLGWAGELTDDDEDPIAAQAALGFTLLRAIVRLDAYRQTQLPAEFLTRLVAGFGRLRAHGTKAVIRFVYNFPEGPPGRGDADATLPFVVAHLTQLAPVLRDNADVIGFVEAGFIGAWGEWHHSTAGLERPENRRRVRDALLAAVPPERFVLFRTPALLAEWSPEPVPAGRALDGSGPARSGLHNDCFLSTPTDANTYPTPALRDYAARQTAAAPFGGETCETRQQRLGCEAILTEGRQFALTYLNRYYATPAFIARWQHEGCADEVARSIGYRFVLVDAAHPAVARAGASWPLRLTVRNAGWARLYNPRSLVVRLTHARSGRVVESIARQADPRRWLPDERAAVDATIELPADLPAGDWDVAIGLPDPAPTLAADARYAIRPANSDQPALGQRWDAERARFALGTRLRVVAGVGRVKTH